MVTSTSTRQWGDWQDQETMDKTRKELTELGENCKYIVKTNKVLRVGTREEENSQKEERTDKIMRLRRTEVVIISQCDRWPRQSVEAVTPWSWDCPLRTTRSAGIGPVFLKSSWHLPDIFLTSSWHLPHIFLTSSLHLADISWHIPGIFLTSFHTFLTYCWHISGIIMTSCWHLPASSWHFPDTSNPGRERGRRGGASPSERFDPRGDQPGSCLLASWLPGLPACLPPGLLASWLSVVELRRPSLRLLVSWRCLGLGNP